MACSGTRYVLCKSAAALFDEQSDAIYGFNRLNSLAIPNFAVKNRSPRICAAATVFSDPPVSDQDPSSSTDNLEEWVKGSVTEIVKNIRQAPLLIQIYANGEVKTEKAVKNKSWRTEKSSSLDGIILVEELGENNFKEEGGTQAFGVLIQGKIRGRDYCKSACYLLKTSSVNGGGLGFICSHYCLIKVKSFTETASSQLKDSWLVN